MPDTVTSPAELAQRIRRLAEQREVVIVGIAGYGGSGKSTLARALQALLPDAARVRGDDFLDPLGSRDRSDDWLALHRDELAAVLEALRAGRPADFLPVDWATGGRQPARVASVAAVQLVDAVGLLHPELLPLLDLTVWVDVPLETATVRGMRRDREAGDDHDALWREVWAPNERAFDARHAPRERADLRYAPPVPDSP
ncbi:phosphoglycerate transporter [Agrococcus sp. ARC_14]|uniref:uridine kinase family protein n=1 Tax=Agrococcus sp. ARC_14 TaxID=2919927 RepID=UPI001F062F9E|nr:phosphoglycerate transporter [Agrococcus sp. ARC_14]MCH1881760.1 phosphoglycerate transporter [Agrococcus sp. ARC_14]